MPTNSPPRSAHWPPVLDSNWALHRALVANFHRSGFTVLGPDGEALQYEDIWDNIADGLSSLFDGPPGDGEPLDQPAASPVPEPVPAPPAPSNESPLTPLSHFSDAVAVPSSPRSELPDFAIPEPRRPVTSTQTIVQRPVQYPAPPPLSGKTWVRGGLVQGDDGPHRSSTHGVPAKDANGGALP
ncbi:hypothetical protein WOLCODRAFT_157707 [Wolfiporia cocos MD-104 SS10]|uniref:Uncharacterized protein n=1 Tax=Wolfiporia cocos (strain MD-104) TaxID=742152 RepID=A0A2H3JE48_WOLCO|nr:hypothetical protein WOLCODRAFT_157707 [Wolfiporia cocos MD-104 SS10]